MSTINERFAELRKACKKNQTDFGKVIGISRSGITDIETGRRNVTEKHLLILSNWDEYNVNIDWLRTGEGDMFLPVETDTLESLRNEFQLTDAQFRFISNFLRLSDNEKDIIFHFLESVFVTKEKTIQEAIDEELAEYRKDLEIEASQTEKSSISDVPNAKNA